MVGASIRAGIGTLKDRVGIAVIEVIVAKAATTVNEERAAAAGAMVAVIAIAVAVANVGAIRIVASVPQSVRQSAAMKMRRARKDIVVAKAKGVGAKEAAVARAIGTTVTARRATGRRAIARIPTVPTPIAVTAIDKTLRIPIVQTTAAIVSSRARRALRMRGARARIAAASAGMVSHVGDDVADDADDAAAEAREMRPQLTELVVRQAVETVSTPRISRPELKVAQTVTIT